MSPTPMNAGTASFVGRSSWPSWALAWLLVVAPVVLSLVYIWRYTVDVVFWDQWELVPLLEKTAQGRLTFGDLHAQHNEHRILFPRLVMLLLAKITRYDVRAEAYAGWIFLLTSFGALLIDHLQRLGKSAASLLAFAPIAWLLMSLRQTDNLLWGWQLQIFLCQCSAVVACVALTRAHRSWKAMALAMLSGAVCSYSFSSGLAIWPVGALYLLWTWRRPLATTRIAAKPLLLAWTVFGGGIVASYLIGYHKPGYHPSLTHFLEHPLDALYFYATALGSSLAQSADTAAAAGVILILLWALLGRAVVRHWVDEEQAALAIPLVAWALMNAFLILVGRSGFSADYGNASRYTTLTMLGVIGAYRAILAVSPGHAVRHFAAGLAGPLVVLGLFASLSGATVAGEKSRADRREMRTRLVSYTERSDADLSMLYPRPEDARTRAATLETLRLSVFRRSPRPSP